MSTAFITVDGLRKHYQVHKGLFGRGNTLHAVGGVSFSVARGDTFGLVGESGSGKSTIAKVLLAAEPPSGGTVQVAGQVLTQRGPADALAFHRAVQPVLQDPYTALSPLMRIADIIGEPMAIHGHVPKAQRSARMTQLLGQVGLSAETASRHPHALSGGQRQRVAIARALAMQPQALVLDEPVSALDVSVQAQILNLLKDLQAEGGLTYVLISHDLAVVAHMATQIGVLYLGSFMEIGTRDEVVHAARHPYTQALIASSESRVDAAPRAVGEIPSPMNLPPGCHFAARCPHATPRCRAERPALRPLSASHWIACHLDLPLLSPEGQTSAASPTPH